MFIIYHRDEDGFWYWNKNHWTQSKADAEQFTSDTVGVKIKELNKNPDFRNQGFTARYMRIS